MVFISKDNNSEKSTNTIHLFSVFFRLVSFMYLLVQLEESDNKGKPQNTYHMVASSSRRFLHFMSNVHTNFTNKKSPNLEREDITSRQK
jgi:hypothetical protein